MALKCGILKGELKQACEVKADIGLPLRAEGKLLKTECINGVFLRTEGKLF